MLRVILINPPPHRVMEAFYDTPPFPRPALAFLAGYLRKAGVVVEVLDCKYSRVNFDGAIDHIMKFCPDVVAITAMTNEVIQAGQIASQVKAWRPETVTVVGGVHATALPERTLREFKGFDFAVVGEGEIPLLRLIEAVENGTSCEPIAGVATIDTESTYRYGGKSPSIDDMDTLPVPAWDMFQPAREYMLHTARGCPFHCPYCMNFNGRKVRQKSIEAIIDEIEGLVRNGARSIIFGDEVFTINRKRTVEFCDNLIKRGLHKKFKWWCVSHVRCIDYELAVLMKKAGCRMLGLGIESGDEARLREINKGTSVEIIIDAVKSLKKAGLPFEAYFILGYPDETAQSAKDTIEFAVKLNPNVPVFGIMVPYPGTRIAELAEKGEGGYILQAKNWNDYNKQIGNAISFKNLNRRELERIQLFGYVKVFLINLRFWDFAKFLWRYRLLAWNSFLKMAQST